MEQFSSKADLYDYLKNHLQVSDHFLIKFSLIVLPDALRHANQRHAEGHLQRQEGHVEAELGQLHLCAKVRRAICQVTL